MYYRRKILLALIELFGGSLSQNRCRKLLLSLNLHTEKNYYDFFSYQHDNLSLVLSQDKKCLTDSGFLVENNDFQLRQKRSYLNELKIVDRQLLQNLLIDEDNQTHTKIQANSCGREFHTPFLFTVGYEALSIDAYLNILLSYDVDALIDVRNNPISRKYGFSKRQLASATRLVGITYIHLPQLGIPSALRKNLEDASSYKDLFDHYYSDMLPQEVESMAQLRMLLNNFERVALTCFEADYHFCHRHKIVEHLEVNSILTKPVMHLDKSSILPN